MAVIPKSAIANVILNRAAAEVGVTPVTDPFASTDDFFVQMRYLLLTAGEELSVAHPWEFQNREHAIVTAAGGTNKFPLPEDFNYMIDQSGWERSNQTPLFGPLSSQDWQYLMGRDLSSQTIYASFRINEAEFWLMPDPPPAGLDIHFEYQSVNWVQDGADPSVFKSNVTSGGDIVMFDRTLITRYLKLKSLDAKGFETTNAQDDFNQYFSFITGRDKGAEVLNAGNTRRGLPYIGYYNIPATGYGVP